MQTGEICLDILKPAWSPTPACSHLEIIRFPLSMQTGEICLDILKSAWSPAWTLLSVCQAVVALMSGKQDAVWLGCWMLK